MNISFQLLMKISIFTVNPVGENSTDQWLGVAVKSHKPGGKIAVRMLYCWFGLLDITHPMTILRSVLTASHSKDQCHLHGKLQLVDASCLIQMLLLLKTRYPMKFYRARVDKITRDGTIMSGLVIVRLLVSYLLFS